MTETMTVGTVFEQWIRYDRDYEKEECDIKLHDGEILKHCYPNAGVFTLCCSDRSRSIPEEDVAEIMYRKYYLQDLCTGDCNEHGPKTEFDIILNEQTPAVPEVSLEDLLDQKQLLLDFLDHAKRSYKARGLALAGNQVGIVSDDSTDRFMLPVIAKRADKEEGQEEHDWFLVLNPKIIETEGKCEEKTEYCLTWPDKVILAERHHTITVQYYDIHGEDYIDDFSGFEAQIWQHEINHLLGIEEKVVASSGGVQHSKTAGRNDPCVCGSGKKYKKCCI